MSDKIEQLDVVLKGLEAKLSDALEASTKQAAEAGKVSKDAQDRVGLAEKALLDAKAEMKAQVEQIQAQGGEVSKATEKRLADLEKRFGRMAGSDTVGQPTVTGKTIGRQFTDFMAENSEMVEKAKREQVRGARRLMLGAANFFGAVKAADLLKANFINPTEENLQKALALSDATNFAPVYRDANLPIMPRRRLAMRDLIPSRPIGVNAYEYLEHVGMGENTANAMTSITSTGTAAIATSTSAHGLRVGDWVRIEDSTDTDYNGNFRVTGITNTTVFTYTMAADPGDDSADGTIVWRNLSKYGAAASVSEAGLKPQSKLFPVLRTGNCQVLAHAMKVTRQALDDVAGLEADINTYGVRGLAEEEEDQLLYGDGSAPNLTGILSNALIQARTQSPAGSVGLVSAFRQAMTDIELSGGMASAIVLNPVNWETTELARGLDDHFLFQGGLAGNEPRIWRVPIVVSKSIAPGTALIGAFDEAAVIYDRQAANISFADQHDTDFLYNLLTIRFEERLGFAITRPEMFVNLTLL